MIWTLHNSTLYILNQRCIFSKDVQELRLIFRQSLQELRLNYFCQGDLIDSQHMYEVELGKFFIMHNFFQFYVQFYFHLTKEGLSCVAPLDS